MFTVNNTAVNRENEHTAAYDMGILERAKTSRFNSYSRFNLDDEISEEQKAAQFNAQIRENYKRLISKDRPEVQETAENRAFSGQELLRQYAPVTEEELKPTPTTMQFIGMEKDEFELKRPSEDTKESVKFRLSAKAKLFIVIYTAVIALLFTLIVLNTKALSSLNADIEYMTASVRAAAQESAALESKLQSVSTFDYIAKYAKEILGMVLTK